MRHRLRRLAPLALALLLPLPLARADEVTLQGGSKVRGTVLDTPAVEKGPRARYDVVLDSGELLTLALRDVQSVQYATDAPTAGQYLRFVAPAAEKGGADGGLEVAVAHFMHPNGGPRVDLVSAVHIADPAYFQGLQRWLDAADAVLYEGVKPAAATPAEFQKPSEDVPNPIRGLQQKMAGWFGLAFQLDAIDYTRANFIHADLTAEELEAELGAGKEAEKGESKGEGKEDGKAKPAPIPGLPTDLSQLTGMLEQIGPMLEMLFAQSPDMRNGMKRMFAQLMGRPEVMSAVLDRESRFTEIVLHRRNEVVVRRLQARIREQPLGDISILYGAAHMADLEKTLVEKLGYRRVGARWLKAWKIEAGPPPAGMEMLEKLPIPGLGGPKPKGDDAQPKDGDK